MGVLAACGEGVALLDARDVVNAIHSVGQALTDGGVPGQRVLLVEPHINVVTQEAIHSERFWSWVRNLVLTLYCLT